MVGVLRRFAHLLTRPKVAPAAFWSVLARLPVYLMTLAIVLVVREQGGSYAQAGTVAAVYTLAMAVLGPWVGRQADRHGHRPVLLVTGVAFPLSMAVFIWWTEPGTVGQLAMAAVSGSLPPPANSSVRSLWARLPLDERAREAAYLWEALLTELLIIGSPLLLAALMITGSASLGLTTITVIGGVAACGFALTPALAAVRPSGGGAVGLGPLCERGLLTLFGLMAGYAVPIGLLTLAIPAFVDQHGERGHTGFVYACWGIGSALGVLVMGNLGTERPDHQRFPWLVLAYAVGLALPVLAFSELTLGLALAVGGLPIALVAATELSLVRGLAEPHTLTEAFTWASTATVVGEAVGQQLGGLLVERAGARGVFVLGVAVALAVAALCFAARGVLSHRAPQEEFSD
ncbi:putative arabinose efflux permease, MFS family [Streptoalloteichus tenebrarius]|uniref:Arabinose efflux permease, MFS family n=1 Tax=Streptoalloteichus tenebrarius (strain ATCC 17920 / DSM 40477 / JCM 4838 / CBS 697.72 / NBRC 16177 / NCIMB 11028 / NRRL B-12390 / A12253. 1 / ISP 5477) TaxID=1933 RepID=A0ABT1HPH4_STRSD|nr:MFS transporter [Streptoalloteichus tenebrarius]MCP2257412.1 putative arabinose efflux permease, MFS family [Streptoalloteichus tenebrarius]BFE98359.1 MFS transporter [Streptoalloteichus tenebrarius]